jgi:ADP-ribose pyrophosphatase
MKIELHQVELPSGERGSYEVDVSLSCAVAVLVVDGHEAILTHQYRYPIDQWIYDLPGGAAEAGENAEEAARREVLEELGVEVGVLTVLQSFYPNPGRAAWPVHLFFGSLIRQESPDGTDSWEQIGAARMPLSEVAALVRQGEIQDPSLLIAWQSAVLKGLVVV